MPFLRFGLKTYFCPMRKLIGNIQNGSTPKPPLLVGVTGGIGSGKSTVCKIFEFLGVPVYYADDRAKAIMVESPEVIVQISNLFGSQAYRSDGTLNRKHIAYVAFNNKEKLDKLNKIVHPAVFEDSQTWLHANIGSAYCIKEAALLVESGSYKYLDKLIVVTAPEGIRLQRVLERDKTTKEAVLSRMASQLPEEIKVKHADYIIENDGKHSILQ